MKKKLLKMSRRKVCKENVFKKTKKNRKKFMLWEEGEAETLIKDKRLCLSPFFCVPQQLLHHFFPPTPTPPSLFFSHLLQWQAHSLTLCSVPAAWESAIQPPLRAHTHINTHNPHACICNFYIFGHKYTRTCLIMC